MSFILDALRKSEHERQRQGGPGIADIRTVGSGSRLPVWAVALGALLLVNIIVVLALVFRGESGSGAAEERAAAPTVAMSDGPAPAVQPSSAPPSSMPPSSMAAPSSAPSSAMPSPRAPESGSTSPGGESAIPLPRRIEPAPRDDAGSQDFGTPRTTRRADPELSPEPESDTYAEDLPSLAEVAARPGSSLPGLHLDIHVYASRPSERFVFLNMRKYREGSSTPEGTLVERITRDGVVLNHRGLRFVMPRQ